MGAVRKFLIIDDNAENRFLLTKTVLRKFPQAIVQECEDIGTAVAVVGTERVDVVISHRAGDCDGVELIRALRAAHATVPILMVSGYDRSRDAIAAGATRFLNYDEWLRVGTIVAEILTPSVVGPTAAIAPPPAPPAAAAPLPAT